MLKNHLVVAWRNLVKHKMFSLINILGLTIGITCTSLLYLYIHDELSHDSFHKNADNIFRVLEVYSQNDQQQILGQTSPPVAIALENDYPEVAASTRLFRPIGHVDTRLNGERIHERNYYLVEQNFFEVFDFEFVRGDAQVAFASPNSLVITESTAAKYFGNQDPMGKVLEFQNYSDATVTGVVKNVPGNSHLQFDLLINGNPTDSVFTQYLQNWNAYGSYAYLVLGSPDQLVSLQEKSQGFVQQYWSEQPNRVGLRFQNIKDIYFKSASVEFGNQEAQGEIRYLYLFGAVGFFLLLIACINYINLATAKSGTRSREIGIRKVSGAFRWQLVSQFLIESMVISSVAFLMSLGLVKILLPYFNQITEKQFQFGFQSLGEFLLVLLTISLVIGLLSGFYPAFYLARLKPTKAVKGEIKTGSRSLMLRQVLVITQFTLSIIMIIATMVTSKQMQYIRGLNLGYDQDQLAIVDINNSNVRSNFETMKYEFEKVPGVLSAAASSRVPGEWKDITQIFVSSDQMAGDSLQSYFMCFDEDMIPTYGMEMVHGDNFSGDRLQDSTKVIINQELATVLGWDDPVGKYLNITGTGDYQVIGVVKEFHFQSLHQDIAPLVIGPWSNAIRSIDYFSLKLSGQNLSETLMGIKNVHEQFDNTTAVELHFLDQQLDRFYRADARSSTLFTIGAGLTVFIACLGLFGLASFIFQRRTKEISIRKVLGATVANLIFHLSRSFIRQILLAFAIAVPIAWWFMYHWLGYFAYRVNIGVGEFLWALTLSLTVGLVTIGHRALQTSMANPASTLKSE